MKFNLSVLSILFISLNSYGAYLESTIYEIDNTTDFVSKSVINNTNRTNIYTLVAYKVNKPGSGNENIVITNSKEVLWSPLKITLKPGEKNYFKLYYKGPKDEFERYYRVIYKESPMVVYPIKNDIKHTDVTPVVSISTILVVRPRKINFNFYIDESTGVIKNTGNTFFRIIIQRGCNGDDETSKQLYILPGELWRNPQVSNTNKKYIVAMNRYIQLGKGCFKNL
ncbi:molecular chaperone [Klebsiella aerogenes]|uniref:molecular chaperone n=1 Tax=Klebsiella aerogenes TaxID=548 RepID=UPI0032DAAB2A